MNQVERDLQLRQAVKRIRQVQVALAAEIDAEHRGGGAAPSPLSPFPAAAIPAEPLQPLRPPPASADWVASMAAQQLQLAPTAVTVATTAATTAAAAAPPALRAAAATLASSSAADAAVEATAMVFGSASSRGIGSCGFGGVTGGETAASGLGLSPLLQFPQQQQGSLRASPLPEIPMPLASSGITASLGIGAATLPALCTSAADTTITIPPGLGGGGGGIQAARGLDPRLFSTALAGTPPLAASAAGMWLFRGGVLWARETVVVAPCPRSSGTAVVLYSTVVALAAFPVRVRADAQAAAWQEYHLLYGVRRPGRIVVLLLFLMMMIVVWFSPLKHVYIGARRRLVQKAWYRVQLQFCFLIHCVLFHTTAADSFA